MKTQSQKNRLSLVSEANDQYGPSYLRGMEAVEVAETFGFSLRQTGQYVEDKWTLQPDLTPEEARAALVNAPATADRITLRAAFYRDHTILLEGDEHRILDGDNEVIAYLHKDDNIRAAALFIDGIQRGQEQGKFLGRSLAQREISEVAGLFLGPVVQPIIDAIKHIKA